MRFEIIDHGWNNSQYFQGCGVAYTDYDSVVTGCGHNAKDAYENAVENLFQTEDTEKTQRLRLPKRPRGIRATDHVPARSSEDCYWYVSIRYSL